MILKPFIAAVCLLGSLSAVRAHTVLYTATLTGAAEAPPNVSTGTGTVLVTFYYDLVPMRVQATFSNLTGNTTTAHIHAATVAAFTGTSGLAWIRHMT